MTNANIITVELTDMAHGGSALGRHEGKVIFVDGGLPGERVRAAIVEDHKSYAQGRVAEVVDTVPDRIAEPRCPHFGDPGRRFSAAGPESAGRFCGGCQWQHAGYPAQLRYKRAIVADQLQRIGRIEEPVVRPTLGMGTPWHYRNNAQFRLGPDGEFGFVGIDGQTVVDVDVCHTIHPSLMELFEELELDFPALEQVTLRAGINTGDQMVILQTADNEPPAIDIDISGSCVLNLTDGPAVALAGDTFIEEELLGHQFWISAGSFFQVNTEMAVQLVNVVRDYLDPRGYEVLLDLYCGVGTFGVCLADSVTEVIGVEENPVAVDDAVANAEMLGNVWFYEGPVEETLPGVDESIDLVVLDPPRTGVEREALETLAGMRASRIVYVSCDPATLARDVRRLGEAGYRLVEVQPVDLFPQTYHIESVALLESGNGKNRF
ncbi:MAG: 23S rRNA (uracil-C(5))-methyltransferase RlmCD [Anaerolineales bacterium]|nr:23S rRNA (uracil-C(5))-methyltransferase RlmCD [Anaerolineales bacterium]